MNKFTKSIAVVAVIILTGIGFVFGISGCDSDGNMADLFNFEPSPDTMNELKPLIVEVIKEPQAFTANDDKVHLVYEVQIENFTTETIELTKLSVFGVTGDEAPVPLQVLEGGDLMVRTLLLEYHPFKKAPLEAVTTDIVGPGQTSISFLDVTLDSLDLVPDRLINVIEIDGPPIIAQILGQTALTVSIGIDTNTEPPLVIGSPIKGGKWINLNGCCDFSNSAHRRIVRSVDGIEFLPERYAIDILKVDDENNLFVGDANLNESWLGYGEELFAVADGVVSHVVKGLPDNKPGESPPFPISLFDGAGNNVILYLGNDTYVLYGHLIPGSNDHLEVGDFVSRGDFIGLLGNTGVSGAPHLHFQVMDGNSIAEAEGVTFEFEEFNDIGLLLDVEEEDGDDEGDGLDIDNVIRPDAEEEEPQNSPGIILTGVETFPQPILKINQHQLQFTIIEFPE